MSTVTRKKSLTILSIVKNYPVIVIFFGLIILFSILYHQRFLSPANLTATLRQLDRKSVV